MDKQDAPIDKKKPSKAFEAALDAVSRAGNPKSLDEIEHEQALRGKECE